MYLLFQISCNHDHPWTFILTLVKLRSLIRESNFSAWLWGRHCFTFKGFSITCLLSAFLFILFSRKCPFSEILASCSCFFLLFLFHFFLKSLCCCIALPLLYLSCFAELIRLISVLKRISKDTTGSNTLQSAYNECIQQQQTVCLCVCRACVPVCVLV